MALFESVAIVISLSPSSFRSFIAWRIAESSAVNFEAKFCILNIFVSLGAGLIILPGSSILHEIHVSRLGRTWKQTCVAVS